MGNTLAGPTPIITTVLAAESQAPIRLRGGALVVRLERRHHVGFVMVVLENQFTPDKSLALTVAKITNF